MSDITELLKFLHGAGLSALPWVCIVVLIWFLVAMKPYIVSYINSNKEYKVNYIKKESERNEIIRNCSATIEACTTALEMVSNDRKYIMDHINNHEEMSKERMEHIQTVVNQCRDEILKARGDLKSFICRN